RPPSNFIYSDPRTLIKWVEKGVARINELNQQHARIIQLILDDRISTADRKVPTYKEWKKASNIGIFFLAGRNEQIDQVDMAIKAYHRAVREQDKVKQLAFLFMMQHGIYSHLTQKPNSDRRRAVLNLAGRVAAATEDLNKELNGAPSGTNLDISP